MLIAVIYEWSKRLLHSHSLIYAILSKSKHDEIKYFSQAVKTSGQEAYSKGSYALQSQHSRQCYCRHLCSILVFLDNFCCRYARGKPACEHVIAGISISSYAALVPFHRKEPISCVSYMAPSLPCLSSSQTNWAAADMGTWF